jgi:hypothetical protein
MKNRNKLTGIIALTAIIVFAMSALSLTGCAPKKSEAELAMEAKIAEMAAQLEALSGTGNEAQAAELQAELETAQAGLETTQRERRERGSRSDRQGGRNQQPEPQAQTPALTEAAKPAAASQSQTAASQPNAGNASGGATATQTAAEKIRQAVLNDKTRNDAEVTVT